MRARPPGDESKATNNAYHDGTEAYVRQDEDHNYATKQRDDSTDDGTEGGTTGR
jgi:hypothetical protein